VTTVVAETERSESPSNGSPVIEVQDLVKTYGRDTRAVDGISFGVGVALQALTLWAFHRLSR
jgi:hypothetical protein